MRKVLLRPECYVRRDCVRMLLCGL